MECESLPETEEYPDYDKYDAYIYDELENDYD